MWVAELSFDIGRFEHPQAHVELIDGRGYVRSYRIPLEHPAVKILTRHMEARKMVDVCLIWAVPR